VIRRLWAVRGDSGFTPRITRGSGLWCERRAALAFHSKPGLHQRGPCRYFARVVVMVGAFGLVVDAVRACVCGGRPAWLGMAELRAGLGTLQRWCDGHVVSVLVLAG